MLEKYTYKSSLFAVISIMIIISYYYFSIEILIYNLVAFDYYPVYIN